MDIHAVVNAIASVPHGIETAVYVTSGTATSFDMISEVCRLALSTGRPQRLYYGTDVCEHLLPSLSDMLAVRSLAEKSGLHVTLVTPPCTDVGIEMIRKLLSGLDRDCECVFNDLGVMHLLHGRDVVPVFGRVLNCSVRDPFIRFERYSHRALRLFQSTMAHTDEMQEILRSYGVVRVELDNVVQGVAHMPELSLPVSIYWPYVLIAVSRYCGKEIAVACPGRCPKLNIAKGGREMVIYGTGSYYLNNQLPLFHSSIDRAVYQHAPMCIT